MWWQGYAASHDESAAADHIGYFDHVFNGALLNHSKVRMEILMCGSLRPVMAFVFHSFRSWVFRSVGAMLEARAQAGLERALGETLLLRANKTWRCGGHLEVLCTS
jgi:hypothetical protein